MSQEERIDAAIKVIGTELGKDIGRSPYTRAHVYDQDPRRGYVGCLIGPLYVIDDPDCRLWVKDRELDGTRTMSLVVQDRDDDAFLNSNAMGAEHYPRGPFWLYTRTQQEGTP